MALPNILPSIARRVRRECGYEPGGRREARAQGDQREVLWFGTDWSITLLMPRPVTFDRTLARGQALRLFWRKGYQATSLFDLTHAMAISRSSFYAAFGDKRSLFLECLDSYGASTLDLLTRQAEGRPPLEAIRRFFEAGMAPFGIDSPGLGCLLVNASLELAAEDPALSARANDHLAQVQAAFEGLLTKGGHAPDEAAKLADFLMVLLEGLRVSGRRAASAQTQHVQIQTAFRILGAARPQHQPMEIAP